jgi:acyl carrier protein
LTIQFSGDKNKQQADGNSKDTGMYDIIDKALNLPPGSSRKNSEATLLELGADSLGLAKIVSSAKRTLGHQLDMATMFSFPSVGKVIEMAQRTTGNQTASDTELLKPAAFSLLPSGGQFLESICRQAGIKSSDVEDAFPLSANQKAYLDVFVGDYKDTNLMWQMNRYKISEKTDSARLADALGTLQRHEESLRWVLSEDPEAGLMVLQLRPGVDSCVEKLRCDSQEEAGEVLESRLASCKHQAGRRTATMFLIEIGKELEMTFIESHFFTEGQGRSLLIEALNRAYNGQPLEVYTSYTSFVERHPVGHDSKADLEFWRKEASALEFSEGSDWALKQKVLKSPVEYINDRLSIVGVTQAVEAPFKKLTVQTGMTIPFIVEAVYALSLALYFGQQDQAFLRGSVGYDRCVSLRTAEPQFSTVRAITNAYHPNVVSLDLAKSSLW